MAATIAAPEYANAFRLAASIALKAATAIETADRCTDPKTREKVRRDALAEVARLADEFATRLPDLSTVGQVTWTATPARTSVEPAHATRLSTAPVDPAPVPLATAARIVPAPAGAPASAAQQAATPGPKAKTKAGKPKAKPAPKADPFGPYRALQAQCKAAGLSGKGTTAVLTARLDAHAANAKVTARVAAQAPAPKAAPTPANVPTPAERLAATLGVKLADLAAALDLTGLTLSAK